MPRRLVLELTNDCNLNCRMCGRRDAIFRRTYFDIEWLRRLEPILDDVEEVTLMGWGEPTLHPDFPAMLRLIRRHGARIYFCTNGMNLGKLREEIFASRVDIIAISLDGSTAGKNAAIRRGADFGRIMRGIAGIVEEKRRLGVAYPYMNFITTLMADNLKDFPAIVRLAGEMGLEEAKAVYLTAFSDRMLQQSLFGRQAEVEDCFARALAEGGRLGVDVKLPAIQGGDPAGAAPHQPCRSPWRDLFVGSDGFVRPCMSTPLKFFHVDDFPDFVSLWLHPALAEFRRGVNVPDRMDAGCRLCYQSSHANWNRRESFIRVGNAFAPEWGEEGNGRSSACRPVAAAGSNPA
jgi:MoaA/NifB/PqqE/SkfB family radical SAM enzyme